MTNLRRAGLDGGFTFVEITVVLVILGILAGIAIGTYVDQVRKADRSAVVSALGNLPVIAESLTADTEGAGYSDDQSAYEQQLRLDFIDGDLASDGPEEISVLVGPDGDWVAFASASREHCYYLRLERVGNGRFEHREPLSVVACRADEYEPADALGDDGWGG